MYKALNAGEATTPWLKVKERGSVDKYDFTAGTTIADQLSLGITISVTDINYRMYSDYQEGFAKANNNGFSLKNDIHTEGSGFQVGLGLIYKPVNALRFGLSYQSPTWYSMTDHFSAAITENVSEYLASNIVYNPNFTKNTGTSYAEYNMRTPDKWTLSIAGVIGQAAIISADYELTNYKNMKLSDDDDKIWTNSQKQYISEDFKAASTLRLGAEVRFTPQFSGRVGYMWQQSPLEKNFRDGLNEVVTGGTINHFTLDGDANYFTYGLGYRFSKSFYTDVAFVMRSQESDLYPFSNIFFDDKSTLNVVPAKLKTNTFSGLLTMGFRF
jgi:long-subunit fatty acid transport protein